MKLLSIGNSFSQDAHKWLSPLAEAYGGQIDAVNLYIGGCPLEAHWNNYVSGEAVYDLELNGEKLRKISISESLQSDDWDVITLQQASRFCGDPTTYEPYLTNLADAIRDACPTAVLWLHQTWAYETDFSHEWFEGYGYDQARMYRQLMEANRSAARKLNCPILPVGEVIQHIRTSCPGFDYRNGGLSLNRDGFHLSRLYGRYAAALTWFACLTGADIHAVKFIPVWEGEAADPALLQQINHAAAEILAHR